MDDSREEAQDSQQGDKPQNLHSPRKPSNLSDRPLWMKMNNEKRNNLVGQLHLGEVFEPSQQTEIVHRPIFDSLRRIVYDPEKGRV